MPLLTHSCYLFGIAWRRMCYWFIQLLAACNLTWEVCKWMFWQRTQCRSRRWAAVASVKLRGLWSRCYSFFFIRLAVFLIIKKNVKNVFSVSCTAERFFPYYINSVLTHTLMGQKCQLCLRRAPHLVRGEVGLEMLWKERALGVANFLELLWKHFPKARESEREHHLQKSVTMKSIDAANMKCVLESVL